MVITIDTDNRLLRCDSTEYPLFSAGAFQILSRQWMALGWNLGHWSTFSWMGRQFLQYPDDVLRLGELLWRLRPTTIVETGVYDGGSTLFFATLCRHVISIERDFRPGVREAIFQSAENLVTFIEGDSASPDTAALAGWHIQPGERVCVFLDSDRSAKHVRAELENLSPLVSPGSYLIVGGSSLPDLAAPAVDEFLAAHPEFQPGRPSPLFRAEFDFTALSYFPMTWLRRG